MRELKMWWSLRYINQSNGGEGKQIEGKRKRKKKKRIGVEQFEKYK